jgi:quercetin dioxygenase-like cupin family protein
MCFGPTATAADTAKMPPPELAVAHRTVRATSRVAPDGSRQLLFVVDGEVEVTASYMRTTLGRGDVLFLDGTDPATYAISTSSGGRVVQLDVADEWAPEGIVAPSIDEEHGRPLVQRMYVHDEQARFRSADELFDDVARPVSRAMFMCLSPDQFGDWHTEAMTSLVVVLAGGFELEVGGDGGSTQVFRAGDVCLVQDHTGQGHISRTHGETRFVAISVPEEHVWPIA